MRVTEYKRKNPTVVDKEKASELVKKARKEAEKLVKGRFEFEDAKGGWIDFTYRQFPGEPIVTFHLNHGEVCELPMGVVKHINNTVRKIRKLDMADLDKIHRGVPPTYEVQSRIKFIPMDFI